MSTSHPSRRRGQAVIVLVAFLTFAPLLLAWYYARHPELITRHNNYGQLIQPSRVLNQDGVALFTASPAPMDDLRGRWVLIQIASQGCQTTCTETLHKTHQTRLMLNKEISRVRRWLIVPENHIDWTPDAEQCEDSGLIISTASASVFRNLTEAVGGALPDDALILMDPLGNLILFYPSGFDPYGLVKDLRHLLKISQIG